MHYRGVRQHQPSFGHDLDQIAQAKLVAKGKRLTALAITHISIVNSVNLYLIRIPNL
jgi:hypothetical protein